MAKQKIENQKKKKQKIESQKKIKQKNTKSKKKKMNIKEKDFMPKDHKAKKFEKNKKDAKLLDYINGRHHEERENTLTGKLSLHPNGFGFVTVEGYEEDFFVAASNLPPYAFHGDTVEIVVLPASSGHRTEAKCIDVIEHEFTEIVGAYEKGSGFGFVIPDNKRILKDIFIPKNATLKAQDGDKVVCRITDYGSRHHKPEGEVIEILGSKDQVGIDILSAIKAAGIPTEFPEKVLSQAKRVSSPVSEADRFGRLDLRDVTMVTIDGEDSKDLDDAVSLYKQGMNYVLGVHIADVSNYVQESSALDREALKRGTSVYLADRVVPMLPVELSNGICSLNQGEDRLALSCIMTLNRKGQLKDYRIAETVINVNRRMTYTSVKKILVDKDKEEIAKYKELVPMFKQMEKLSGLIRANRVERGSIDFDFPEAHLVLDASGHPIDIQPYEISVANKIIEDFMLMANETVAMDFHKRGIPFVYRTHGKPDAEKIINLRNMAAMSGVTLQGNPEDMKPLDIQKFMKDIEDLPEQDMLTRLALRSMQQARYQTENIGHFGLAAPYYCHFTSPIRRYPDLQIHRIMKQTLRGKMDERMIRHYNEILDGVAQQASQLERRAEETERNVTKMKKAEYMSDFIGEQYDGVISGVTSWGFYVELPNTIEGLVHIKELTDDTYEFSEETFELIGQTKNQHYKMGQRVKVEVTAVNTDLGTVDFVLA